MLDELLEVPLLLELLELPELLDDEDEEDELLEEFDDELLDEIEDELLDEEPVEELEDDEPDDPVLELLDELDGSPLDELTPLEVELAAAPPPVELELAVGAKGLGPHPTSPAASVAAGTPVRSSKNSRRSARARRSDSVSVISLRLSFSSNTCPPLGFARATAGAAYTYLVRASDWAYLSAPPR